MFSFFSPEPIRLCDRISRREANRKKDGRVARLGGPLLARLTDSLELRRLPGNDAL